MSRISWTLSKAGMVAWEGPASSLLHCSSVAETESVLKLILSSLSENFKTKTLRISRNDEIFRVSARELQDQGEVVGWAGEIHLEESYAELLHKARAAHSSVVAAFEILNHSELAHDQAHVVNIGLEGAVQLSTLLDQFNSLSAVDSVFNTEELVSAPAVSVGPKKILIVDDTATNRFLIELQVRKLGYEPVVAESGAKAIELFSEHKFSAVLMDCMMPGMDGYETTKRLREIEIGHTPIIAITANAMAGDREICLNAGMDDYLAKPARIESIQEKLSRWVQGSTRSINTSVLDKVVRDNGGNREDLSEQITKFKTALPIQRQRIIAALRNSKLDKARSTLETLEVQSATLGLNGLNRVCQDIVSALETEEDFGNSITKLEAECKRAGQALAAYQLTRRY